MTTRYLDHEDRIALVAEKQDGGIVCMWLVRPLAQRLVSTLIDLLKPEAVLGQQAQAVESFKQAAAEHEYQPTSPVKSQNPDLQTAKTPAPAASSASAPQGGEIAPPSGEIETDRDGIPTFKVEETWLIREINVKVFDAGYRLTFLGRQDEFEAQSGFSETLLRQWLGILRKLCLVAGWTNPDWPDWMKSEGMMNQGGALPN